MNSRDKPVSEAIGPRRSALAQNRSKATRRRLVRAALELWAARGFETGVEDTTADEIAHAAGVTKRTFYVHFAHKEDVLLEIGYGTAEALYEQAEVGIAAGTPGLALLRRLLKSLARQVESLPRAAVQKTMNTFFARALPSHGTRLQMQDAFRLTLDAARDAGELPADADVTEVAHVLQVLAMDAIVRWSSGDRNLGTVLQRRVTVLLAGVRPPEAVPASTARAAAAGDEGDRRDEPLSGNKPIALTVDDRSR